MTRRDFPQKLNGPWIMPDRYYQRDSHIASLFAFAVALLVIGILGYYMAVAWVAEDEARVENLRMHKQNMIERQIQ